jgi:uncharacterized protein (TIGR00297 family)
MSYTQLLLGLGLAVLIAGLAYWRGSLSRSGALGATLIGTVVFGLGGWGAGVLLVLFFVSSSALSHYKEQLKAQYEEKFSKGHRRDLAQTLANGGVGAVCLIAGVIWPSPVWWPAFVGAIATVNADTWATELGVLARRAPRLVTTWRPVEPGTSGAVTTAGTAAAAAGAGLISLAAAGFTLVGEGWMPALVLLGVGTLAGLAGSLFDSLLGASVQAIYFVDALGKETEQHPLHRSGHPTRLVRGWPWLSNDLVNFLASCAGAALAGLLVGVL